MKIPMYAVRDDVAEIYNAPFCETEPRRAMRAFQQSFPANVAPEEYTLYRVGMYDSDSGCLEPEAPTIICKGERRSV